MKATILASTNVGYSLPIEEAMKFSGHEAGICYMPDNIKTLFAEPEEKTIKRANGTLKSGHHSVFGHVYYNFSFEEVPKILAMVLNNEKVYNTSEKSARYTKMKTSEEEEILYEKWIDIYNGIIVKEYPNISEKQVKKLAMENARYLISVFTPATTMGYSTDFRQMSYILHWLKKFNLNAPDTAFNIKLKNVFKDFEKNMIDLGFKELDDGKDRNISLFVTRTREEEFGENYCVNYKGTFAQLAQAQRHRTLKYEISIPESPEYFVPYIIRGTEYEKEWLEDMEKLSKNFPQGMLLNINERGGVEDFVLKCKERLCGCAQLEVAKQTKDTMDKYLEHTKNNKTEIYNYLLPYSKGARCTFKDFTCESPCIWGAKYALDRKI